ncbi:hypothetical protein BSZ32_14280 [Rubritalea profundi]|uniref:Uncharacterized protein n=1 Tax=Rubritalea profundi TaxID=1658618 RepID=A0A2S7U3F1_9BACT|nr:hypothetical protein BSZ32_14280 [Rubritalea profundi]
MESEWQNQNLDDLITKRNQGVNTTTEKVTYSESGTTVVRANNITAGVIDYDKVTFVDTETYSRIKDACKPKQGDILYTKHW